MTTFLLSASEFEYHNVGDDYFAAFMSERQSVSESQYYEQNKYCLKAWFPNTGSCDGFSKPHKIL
jgi:hypothetical protein